MKVLIPKIALVTYLGVVHGIVQAEDNTCSAIPGDDETSCVLSMGMGHKLGETSMGIDTTSENSTVSVVRNVDDHNDAFDLENNGNDSYDEEYDETWCVDDHELCTFWASKGECKNNSGFMQNSCKKSCNSCKEPSASSHGASYGEPQECVGEHEEALLKAVEKMDKYMDEEVAKPEYDKVRSECKNRDPLCLYWAHIGECEINSVFMLTTCAPSCETCKSIDFDYRCPPDPDMKNVFEPGDLHKMFERIVDEYENVSILSQPPTEGEFQPWVITVDNFITDDECERLIELGANEGYERSTNVGAKKYDGTFDHQKSETRTSENSWCFGDCSTDPLVQTAMKRIELLTGVPDSHSEFLQLLRYETGQFYRTHHDYIEHDREKRQGPRILTAFLYLNDVEAGGGTNFPDLDLTVMPKKGRLLLWPSVTDSDLTKEDVTTRHQALEVEGGRKYGANAWLHLRDFKTPNEDGCI